MKTQIKHSLIAGMAILSFAVFSGCTGGGTSDEAVANHDLEEHNEVVIDGGDLDCISPDSGESDRAGTLIANDHVTKANVSKEGDGIYPQPHYERSNAKNILKRLGAVVPTTSADGNITDESVKVHPILVGYAEQVIGDYAMNDGSADIGDPYHVDDIFVSLSLDNGQTWKKINVSNTADKSSIDVKWDRDYLNNSSYAEETVAFPGHSHKPTMEVNGNRILVAWHDKYCPSGNPLQLPASDDAETIYPDDLFKVNGAQGSINYDLRCDIADDPLTVGIDESNCAPNSNEVYEVPFSCVWTARGIFDPEAGEITWHQAKQLTTGTRDANKLWIAAAADVGFAMSWQEDPEGLREGKGAGPGEGWSGATTNHGADIWYSYLTMGQFDEVNTTVDTTEDLVVEDETKAKSLYNLTYPVRITDNEVCIEGDTKLYCQEVHCDSYLASDQGTSAKCVTKTLDPLWDDGTTVILDGDTGASRPAMTIAMTNEDEAVVLLAYEETKGLADNSGDGDANQGEEEEVTDIEVEGKVVYFESFHFDSPVTLSPGSIVNPRVEEEGTGDMIYENARRVVIVKQVQACDTGKYTFGLMYKMGVETRGGASDMFLRMNTGFSADTFVAASEIPNVSAMTPVYVDEDGTVSETPVGSTWTPDNLDDTSYENVFENTFSPRGFMRGDDIYTGFEYTPNYAQSEQGNVANNFYINRYVAVDGVRAWQGPQNISAITGRKTSTLDPRFIPTPKGIFDKTGLETDKSNPDVLFLTYGTWNMESGLEEDLFYTRSTDKGATWSTVLLDSNLTANAKLAAIQGVEEKEVQSVTTPDGTVLYNVWLQEQPVEDYSAGVEVLDEEGDVAEHFKGLDSWIGRVDFNETAEVTVDPIE